jgi:hypothetical protein
MIAYSPSLYIWEHDPSVGFDPGVLQVYKRRSFYGILSNPVISAKFPILMQKFRKFNSEVKG